MSHLRTHVLFAFDHPKHPHTPNMTKYLAIEDFLPYLRDIDINPLWVHTISFSHGDLSREKLEYLSRFGSVRQLSFHENKISQIPPVVWKLGSLVNLSCEGNPIKLVPAELMQLPNLRSYQGPSRCYTGIPQEYWSDYRTIIKYQDMRLRNAWGVRYAFIALRCSYPVVHALYEAWASHARRTCFPGS
jgi:hypothetical protein